MDIECTCIIAYFDASVGKRPCDAQVCHHSSCLPIRKIYSHRT